MAVVVVKVCVKEWLNYRYVNQVLANAEKITNYNNNTFQRETKLSLDKKGN
jgi:hypothetical protein